MHNVALTRSVRRAFHAILLVTLLIPLVAVRPSYASCDSTPPSDTPPPAEPALPPTDGQSRRPLDILTQPGRLPVTPRPPASDCGLLDEPVVPAPATTIPTAPQAVPAATGFVWPLRGLITQRPYPGHMGLDIDGRSGDPVVAAASGMVSFAGWHRAGYGNLLVLTHGGGLETVYAHLSGFAVPTGQTIQQGQVIGYVGSTGYSSGSHLHFEVRLGGVRQNPLAYLP